MLSWAPERWISGRECDALHCDRESSPHHCLVATAGIGPVVDRPLCLFFCDDHGDFDSLVDRHRRCIAGASVAAIT